MPNPLGFIKDETQRAAQFATAKDYFDANPIHKKFSRKISALDNSYIQLDNRTILSLSSKTLGGKLLGQGTYGRGKLAMDERGDLYAVKIETTNTPLQNREAANLADLGLLAHPKTSIQRTGQDEKYYTSLIYLGKNLETSLWAIESEYFPSLAREIAWAVHQLHKGVLSQSRTQYAHLDLRPGNMVIDRANHVHLVDFGTAHPLEKQPYTPCFTTSLYAPVTYDEQQNTLDVYKDLAGPRLNLLGPKGTDVFALKRTLYLPSPITGEDPSKHGCCLFSRREFLALKPELQAMINTSDIDQALSRKDTDTPLSLAIAFLALECELELDSLSALDVTKQEDLCEIAAKYSVPLSEDDLDNPDLDLDIDSMKAEIIEYISDNSPGFGP